MIALYYLPSDFGKPFRLYDITNDRKISIVNEYNHFDGNIKNIADSIEGDVTTAYLKEVVGVLRQVSTSGDTIQVKSSANDTTQTCRIEGFVDASLRIIGSVEITLNGVTPATNATTFYKITHFSKSADTTGFVTLEDSSGNDLSYLGQTDRVAHHTGFRLSKIPDDSTTNFRWLYKKKFRRLVNAQDYPFIESDAYLINHAWGYALAQDKETIQRAQIAFDRADRHYNALMVNFSNQLGPEYQKKMVTPLIRAHRS